MMVIAGISLSVIMNWQPSFCFTALLDDHNLLEHKMVLSIRLGWASR